MNKVKFSDLIERIKASSERLERENEEQFWLLKDNIQRLLNLPGAPCIMHSSSTTYHDSELVYIEKAVYLVAGHRHQVRIEYGPVYGVYIVTNQQLDYHDNDQTWLSSWQEPPGVDQLMQLLAQALVEIGFPDDFWLNSNGLLDPRFSDGEYAVEPFFYPISQLIQPMKGKTR